ncbi:MAG: acetoacetate decarboxylase family protein [Promethearchaeota archaeon]
MPYEFKPNQMYRMPTHFGPSFGPRRGKDGRKFENVNTPKVNSNSVSFVTNRKQLEEFLPEGFELRDEPVVTVKVSYITEIEWLAGRGYNTLGVSFPTVFHGKEDTVMGNFLTVLWENLTDPILTGREELGFSKIFCELPEPRIYQGKIHCIASWMGFKFFDMNIWNLKKLSLKEITQTLNKKRRSDGTLHYKYMPRTGEWGKSDIAYATLTPSGGSNRSIKNVWKGEGNVEFHEAKWEDLPTMFSIVNAFHNLEIKEYIGATITNSIGGKDLSDQRILK